MPHSLQPGSQRVSDAFAASGVSVEILELPESTHTALDAAAALNCTVGQIVKSLLFIGLDDGQPVLVLISGAFLVDPAALARCVGSQVRIAKAKEVKAVTGFPIGGVAPVGHTSKVDVLIDRQIFEMRTVWVAAGTPNAVAELTPDELLVATGGRLADVACASATSKGD